MRWSDQVHTTLDLTVFNALRVAESFKGGARRSSLLKTDEPKYYISGDCTSQRRIISIFNLFLRKYFTILLIYSILNEFILAFFKYTN